MNTSRVRNNMLDTGFAKRVLFLFAGYALSDVATGTLRNNVADFQMQGADAGYALATGAIVYTLAPSAQSGKYLAYGTGVRAAEVLANEYGVLEALGL